MVAGVRRAFAGTHESASSRMTILCRPAGSETFFCANCLILLRTTSMPLRVRARACQLQMKCDRQKQPAGEVRGCAPLVRCVELEHALLVGVAEQSVRETVDRGRLADTGHALQVESKGNVSIGYKKGGQRRAELVSGRTEMMMCGILPSSAMTLSRSTVSLFPTTSSSLSGRYFSTLLDSKRGAVSPEGARTRSSSSERRAPGHLVRDGRGGDISKGAELWF